MAWSSFRNILSRDQSSAPDEFAAARAGKAVKKGAPTDLTRMSLDAIGQRDEVVRQRIGSMNSRLEDLRSLQDDFANILEPLVSISEELPRAGMRVAELEKSLTQERLALVAARQEAAESARRVTELGNALSDTTSRAEQAEAESTGQLAVIEELQVSLRDKVMAIENLERQLFGEKEQKSALLVENKALRNETQVADANLTRSEHELREARERLGIFDQDNRRLQILSEEQAVQLADLTDRTKEIEAGAEDDRLRLRATETELAAEKAERERIQALYETDAGTHRSERTSLSMRLEAAGNKLGSTEQLLAQANKLLRDRDEAQRVGERAVKEAAIARSTAERRLEALQVDLVRQAERFQESQRLKAEYSSRNDMLTKALAAKDVAIEQITSRNAGLAERVEQLNIRHDAIRSDLELANRRLTEDLENERSERLLAQGALDIARESRTSLQKQHDALKRAGRNWKDMFAEPGEDEQESNVRSFNPGNKSN